MLPGILTIARAPAVVALACALAACGHLPRHSRPASAPQPVHELQEFAADGTATQAFPQYWKRNTLVIDLQSAAASGKLVLKPREGARWPARLAFRVMPGTLGVLDVRAAQRMLIPVTSEGSKPVDLELIAGVYTPKSGQLTVQWGK